MNFVYEIHTKQRRLAFFCAASYDAAFLHPVSERPPLIAQEENRNETFDSFVFRFSIFKDLILLRESFEGHAYSYEKSRLESGPQSQSKSSATFATFVSL